MARKFKHDGEGARSVGDPSAVMISEWDEGGPPQGWIGVEITYRRAEQWREQHMPLHAPPRAVVEPGDPSKI